MTATISSVDPTTASSQSAKAILEGALGTYGLTSLADQVWTWYQQGRSIDQIFLDLRTTPEYKARFPAMDSLAQSGHAITESQYINLEQSYAQLGRQYGLPSGFYDQPSDFTTLISGQVSPTEYSARLQDYQSLVYETDPTTRNELNRLYGITTGDIAAYYIDPEKSLPFLQQRFGAAQAAAAAQQSTFGQLSQNEAETLAGKSPAELAAGFTKLAGLGEVTGTLPGEAGSGISQSDQLAAQFQGNAAAQRRIADREARRVADFGSGGGFTSSKSGISGTGSA